MIELRWLSLWAHSINVSWPRTSPGAQRQARIDPNPHQIDAVIFALRHLREGGCILADVAVRRLRAQGYLINCAATGEIEDKAGGE